MPDEVVHWEIVEAFSKFGFDDGDGPTFTNEVVDALEEAGYQCELVGGGLHNRYIGTVWEGGDLIAEFDGYELPALRSLPHGFVQALEKLSGGPFEWAL